MSEDPNKIAAAVSDQNARLKVLEEAIKVIVSKVEAIGDKMTTVGRPPLIVIISAVGVFSTAVIAYNATQSARFTELKNDISAARTESTASTSAGRTEAKAESEAIRNLVMSRAEITAAVSVVDKKATDNGMKIDGLRETYISRVEFDKALQNARDYRDRQDALVERDLSRLAASQVTRAEHEEKWRTQMLRDETQGRQIEAIQSRLASMFTPSDAIATLQRENAELRRRIDEIVTKLPTRR